MVYTITPVLLKKIEKDELYYFTDLLNLFAQRSSPYKVAMDTKKIALKDYCEIKNHNTHLIKHWIECMSFMPSPFEKIEVNIENIECEEERYLKLCKETINQKKMIVYSKQNIEKHKCEHNIVCFEEITITILDKDDAVKEFEVKDSTTNNTFINSQVAQGQSEIKDSNNE